jgi:hypothetical protein
VGDEDGKDRLGDTLAKKKRADEERFFAEQDRQRVVRMREQQLAVERATRTAACPRCGKTLAQRKVRGVTIDQCGDGHGVWLDAGELEHLGGCTLDERTSILRVVLGDLGLIGKA